MHPDGSKNECLDVRRAAFESNTPVEMSGTYHLSIDNSDTIATVLADGLSMGRPRSDWWAPIFASL